MSAPENLAADYEALLQFLYLAPIGLAQIGANGDIAFINPHAAALLMPLTRDGSLDNLFQVLEPVAPDLRQRFQAYTAPRGAVCDGHRVQLTAGVPGEEDPRFMAIGLVKLGPDRAMAVLSDITQVVKRERQLRQSEAFFNALIKGAEDYALMTVDAHGAVQRWNDGIGRVTGFEAEAVRGRSFSVFYPEGGCTSDRSIDLLREADENGWSLSDGWRVRADGSRFWGSTMIAPLEADGPLAGLLRDQEWPAGRSYALVLRNIDDQRDAMDQLRRSITLDHLTGLYNRRAFFDAGALELKRWQRRRGDLSLVMIDADHFKAINDRHGHAAGDAVLRDLAEVIAENVREMDTAARVGGEEFAVLLPSTDGPGAVALAQRLCDAVRRRLVPTDGEPIRYTISAGVSSMREGTAGLDALLKQADVALYAAKRSGRDRVMEHEGNGRAGSAAGGIATSPSSNPTS